MVLFGLVGCAAPGRSPQGAASSPAPAVRSGPTVDAQHGVVVSVCPIASQVGADVLRQGGNAVDAAVATAFALAVTWPEAGNIGGGGFMMVARPSGADGLEVQFLDYRETAPAAVKADTFSNQPSQHLLAGTPGTVAGMYLAHQKFGSGKLSWARLVTPAATLADDGFEINPALAASLNNGLKAASTPTAFRDLYGNPDGVSQAAGRRMRLPDLAAALRRIAERGPAGFYEGETAQHIVAEMQRGGGLMTADDLRNYQAKIRTPLTGTFKGHTIHAPPPPSSGGVALLQMLNMLETFDLQPADRWSQGTVHLMVEAMRRAFADRARYVGDPDFGQIPVEKLINKAYARSMAETIDRTHSSRSDQIASWAELPAEKGGQTTHFSVVDAAGMAVSNTYTLEQSFGGKVVVQGAGFLLNNELGDFNPRPGQTTRTGQIGTPPNLAAGGKRPLSSMTPTIVAKDGKVVLVTGSPGGRTIINTVTQVILNRLAFDMPLRDAVDAPRLHHQWLPDGIRVEKSFAEQHPQTLEALRTMGHRVDGNPVARQGDAHSIEVGHDGTRRGVADRRIGGSAAGY